MVIIRLRVNKNISVAVHYFGSKYSAFQVSVELKNDFGINFCIAMNNIVLGFDEFL